MMLIKLSVVVQPGIPLLQVERNEAAAKEAQSCTVLHLHMCGLLGERTWPGAFLLVRRSLKSLSFCLCRQEQDLHNVLQARQTAYRSQPSEGELPFGCLGRCCKECVNGCFKRKPGLDACSSHAATAKVWRFL